MYLKKSFVLIIVLLFMMFLNFSCSTNVVNQDEEELIVREEETSDGKIKEYYTTNGELIKREIYKYGELNIIEYYENKELVKKESYYNGKLIVISYYKSGKLIKEEMPDCKTVVTYENNGEIQITKHNDSTLTAYKVHHSIDDIFYMKNFSYKNLVIDEATVLLGCTIKGYFEAVIFPTSLNTFEISKKELGGEIEYIYLRFEPEMFDELLKNKLVKKHIDNKEKIFEKAISIHQDLFGYMMHSGKEYAILGNDFSSAFIKIVDDNLFFRSMTSPEYSTDFTPFTRKENGRLEFAFSLIWNEYKNGVFKIYYPDNSVIKDNPQEWLSKRQKAFDYICEYLGVEWDYGNIIFYIFNDSEQGKEYGLRLGFAVPSENTIYTLHNQTYGHELTHIISYYINDGYRIYSALVNEGLATFLSMRGDDFSYDRICKRLLEDLELKAEDLLNVNFRNCKPGYFYGASFIGYLINTYGIELFKEFFGQEEYSEEESFKVFYKKDYEVLFNEWVEYLNDNDLGEVTEREQEYINWLLEDSNKTIAALLFTDKDFYLYFGLNFNFTNI